MAEFHKKNPLRLLHIREEQRGHGSRQRDERPDLLVTTDTTACNTAMMQPHTPDPAGLASHVQLQPLSLLGQQLLVS